MDWGISRKVKKNYLWHILWIHFDKICNDCDTIQSDVGCDDDVLLLLLLWTEHILSTVRTTPGH